MVKSKYYLGSGWFSPEQEKNYSLTSSTLKNAGLKIFEPRLDAGNLADGPMTIERAKTIFHNDLVGIDECEGIFADISFRDSGVLVEIGYSIKGRDNRLKVQEVDKKYLNACTDYESHLIEYEEFARLKDEYIKELHEIANSGVDEITIFDNSDRPKMNIMLASAADNCIRNETELQDFANGERVFDLGNTELE